MRKEFVKAGITGFFLVVLTSFLSPSITGYAVKDKSIAIAMNLFFFFKSRVIPRLLEMFCSPFTHTKTAWMIVPLMITIFLMQTYFGRWKNEKLGWNSAFANMIALLFISVGLLYQVTHMFKPEEFLYLGTPLYKAILVGIIILQILLMIIFLFMHAMPKGLSFFIGSPLTVYTIAFVAIVLVYGEIPIDFVTFIAFLCLYLIFQLFFGVFRWLIPPSKQAERYLKKKDQKERKEETKKRRARSLKWSVFKRHFREKYFSLKAHLNWKHRYWSGNKSFKKR